MTLGLFGSQPAQSDPLTEFYVALDVQAIEQMYHAAETLEMRLLCAYRLFPLTRDERWLEDLPDADELTSARELALLSGLWGFRAADAPIWRMRSAGGRSEEALRRARAIDPEEPYVLLIDGQSLYYRPGIFGGDVNLARARFERLRNVLPRREAPGIHPFEPEVWIWMCLRKGGNPLADELKRRLLERGPPPLFRQWLIDPP